MVFGFSKRILTERLRTFSPTIIVFALLILIPLFVFVLSVRYNEDLSYFAEVQAQRAVGLTAERVLEAIESGSEDSIVSTFRSAKSYAENGVMLLLIELWERRVDRSPGLNWDLLDRERIRVTLADVLARASRENRVNVSMAPLLEQFRQSAEYSPDETVQWEAIHNVGLFDDPSDVGLLLQLISSENDRTHRAAMLALAGMCNDEARDAFSRLPQTLPPNRVFFIREAASRFDRSTDESDWCRCRLSSCPEPDL